MPLNVRTWTCDCGTTHDRDVNAAKNLLAAGLAVYSLWSWCKTSTEFSGRAVGDEAGNLTARAVRTPPFREESSRSPSGRWGRVLRRALEAAVAAEAAARGAVEEAAARAAEGGAGAGAGRGEEGVLEEFRGQRRARAATSGRPARRAQRLISRAAPASADPALPRSSGPRRGSGRAGRPTAVRGGGRVRAPRLALSAGSCPVPASNRSSGAPASGFQCSSAGSRSGTRPKRAALPSAIDHRRAASAWWATETATRGSGTESARATFSTRYARGSRIRCVALIGAPSVGRSLFSSLRVAQGEEAAEGAEFAQVDVGCHGLSTASRRPQARVGCTPCPPPGGGRGAGRTPSAVGPNACSGTTTWAIGQEIVEVWKPTVRRATGCAAATRRGAAMSALALAVLLSLVSAVAYAGGAIVQERVAVSTPQHAYAPLRRPALVVRGGAQRSGRAAARGGAGVRPAEPGAAAGRADDRVRAADGGALRAPQGRGAPPGAARSWPRWVSPVCCPSRGRRPSSRWKARSG